MDSMPIPNVITKLTVKEMNFVFRVHAYRKLTPTEMRYALKKWMSSTRHKQIPSNQTIDYFTIHGLDPQDNL